MKSILIIGLGNFGHYLCRNLAGLKNEIMIIDKREDALEDLLDAATSSMIADCTRESVLRRIGVADFDLCFVCIGSDFQSNLEITSLLKDLGAKYVVSKTDNEVHAKFLLRNGADEIIHPNKDIALRAAVKYNNDHIFDFIDLAGGYSVYEITPLREWVGKSILASNIRAKYNIYVIGILSASDGPSIMPAPDRVVQADDHLMVLAHEKTMEKLMKKLGK